MVRFLEEPGHGFATPERMFEQALKAAATLPQGRRVSMMTLSKMFDITATTSAMAPAAP